MAERRARHTAHVLARLGMQEVSRAASNRRRQTNGAAETTEQQRARAIRQTLEQLGPLYVKVGQILSTRPDFVPDYIREELALLTDQAAVRPFATFVPTLQAELGADWREAFASFETDRPLGAASLAQVHRATRRDGTACVVKIQRPGSHQTVLGDMAVLRRVTRVTRVALTAVLAFSTNRGIQTTPNVSILGKAVANMEGTVRHIHPDLKLSDSIRDVLQDILTDMARDIASPEQLAQYNLHALRALTQGPGQGLHTLNDIANRQLTLHNHTRFNDTRFSKATAALTLLALANRHRPS
ncbi:AarF/UbiB family protein [Streptomyces albidoflavus]